MSNSTHTLTPFTQTRAKGSFARLDRSSLIQYGLAALTVAVVVGPLTPIIYQSLIDRPLYDTGQQLTFDNYARLFSSQVFLRAIPNTVVFALLTTFIGTVVGVVAAMLIGRTNVPAKRSLGGLFMWPILLSHLIIAFGWVIIYGPAGYLTSLVGGVVGAKPWNIYSLGGMALVAGVSTAPLTFLYCMASTALSESSLEDAARTCGCGPIRTLFSITLPLLQPAILYSVILNFTGALEMLAIPLVLGEPSGINVFATLLYTQGFAAPKPDYGIVSTAAVLLIVVIFLLLALQRTMLRNSQRFVTVGGKAARPRLVDLGIWRWPVFAVFAAYIVAFILIPIGALFLRASVSILTPLAPFWHYFTLKHYIAVFSDPSNIRAIVNTLLIAAAAGLIGTFFVAVVAIIVHRSDFRFRRGLEFIALLPRAIPGVVAGMGFFYAVVMVPPLGWLRTTLWVITIAYIARFIPLAFGALSPGLLQIGKELDSSARVVGADWWRATRSITLPILKPAMLSSFTLIFVVSLREYSTAIYLFTPGNEVLGVSLLFNWLNGDVGIVAVLSLVQIVLTMIFIYGARLLLGIKVYQK